MFWVAKCQSERLNKFSMCRCNNGFTPLGLSTLAPTVLTLHIVMLPVQYPLSILITSGWRSAALACCLLKLSLSSSVSSQEREEERTKTTNNYLGRCGQLAWQIKAMLVVTIKRFETNRRHVFTVYDNSTCIRLNNRPDTWISRSGDFHGHRQTTDKSIPCACARVNSKWGRWPLSSRTR